MPSHASEPLLIRVNPDVRRTLDDIAALSDCTLSQLVRYATLWWINDSNRTCSTTGVGRLNSSNDGFINVRFAPADMTQIRVIGEQMGLERGAVIRCAVRAWIAAGNFTTSAAHPHTQEPSGETRTALVR